MPVNTVSPYLQCTHGTLYYQSIYSHHYTSKVISSVKNRQCSFENILFVPEITFSHTFGKVLIRQPFFRYTLSDLHYRRITFKRKRQKTYYRIDFALGFPPVNVTSEDSDKVIFRCKSVISVLFLRRITSVDTARSQYDFAIRQTDTRKSQSAVAYLINVPVIIRRSNAY